MVIFVENLCGLQLAASSPALRDRCLVKVIRRDILDYRPETLRGPVLPAGPEALRWAKTILGILQAPIIQQDPNALACRLNLWKRVLSDGMMTELAVQRRPETVKRFYSIRSAQPSSGLTVEGEAIIGSNWLDYESMTEGAYRRHLTFLRDRYPDAKHYCHPRETSRLPEEVFGAERTVRLREPVECYMWREGVPRRLITVCSSAVVSLALGKAGAVGIDLIALPAEILDGPTGDRIKHTRHPTSGPDRISVGDLQALLLDYLKALSVKARMVDHG